MKRPVVIQPTGNVNVTRAIDAYRTLLIDPTDITTITIEDFLASAPLPKPSLPLCQNASSNSGMLQRSRPLSLTEQPSFRLPVPPALLGPATADLTAVKVVCQRGTRGDLADLDGRAWQPKGARSIGRAV